jgi:nitronate monooxygenase
VVDVFDLLDLTLPVVAAPMAGGPSTSALAAAVSEAGGLGFLAAGYKSAQAVATEVAAARSATAGPLGVNLFVVEPYEPDPDAVQAYRRSLEPDAARLGTSLGRARWDDDHWQAKVDMMLDLRPEVVSFTFGCPPREVLHRMAIQGILSSVTVTTVAEAEAAVARGAASLCVQGHHAGGHRGTWNVEAPPDTTPLPALVSAVASTVGVPVVAGGGVVDASSVETLMDNGAVAAQVGTAYLLADEAGTNATHRAAMTDLRFTETALTRAYTGRWARGLANRFIADHADAPAGYPHLHHMTSPLRQAAVTAGDVDVAHLWAGTGHARVRPAAARDITRALAP